MTDISQPDDAARHDIGGNNPPSPIEIQRASLRETYADLLKRHAELMGLLDRLPAAMDDEWEGKITEAVKSCTKFIRNSEVARMDANEPFRALIAANDGFFKALSDAVGGLKTKMSVEYLTPYQQAKADEEKRRRAEDARKAAAAAAELERQRKAKEAELAETRRKEDEVRRDAERREREAREAEQRRKDAAAAEQRRAEDEKRAARQREIDARAAKDKEAADQAKAEREAAQRAIDEGKERSKREAAEAKAEADRIALEEAKERIRLAEERREQQRVTDKARDDAAAAEQRANATKKAAGASQADMSRTRTDLGAIASLRTVYDFEITDHAKVPRQYCRVDDGLIGSAIRAATVEGKCTLKIAGVRIFPKTDSVVR